MKLPAFAHHRARSAEDAVAVLAEHGDEARVLAGGQSLIPLMALRMAGPGVLVDVTAAEDLRDHDAGPDVLVAGAAAVARRVETDPAVAGRHPVVAAALPAVGHVEIRNRGTVGGSVAHADPAAELPAVLLALDGAVEARSARGTRRIAAGELLLGPYTTSLEPDELLTAVHLPAVPAGGGWSVREIARRSGDFAVVGVVAVLAADDPRIALFGVAATAVRASAAEAVLRGRAPAELDDVAIDEAAARAFDDVEVLGDLHGSVTYRRRAGTRLVARALREARDRAAGTLAGTGTEHHREVARA